MKFEQYVNILLGDELELISEQGRPGQEAKLGEIITVNIHSPEDIRNNQSAIDEVFYDAASESSNYFWIGNITDDSGNRISPTEFVVEVVEELKERLPDNTEVSTKQFLDTANGIIRQAVNDIVQKYKPPKSGAVNVKYVTRILINVLLNATAQSKKLQGYNFEYSNPIIGKISDGEKPKDSALPTKDSTPDNIKVVKSVRSLSDEEKEAVTRDITGGDTYDSISLLSGIFYPGDIRPKTEIVTDLANSLRSDDNLSGDVMSIIETLKDNGIIEFTSETLDDEEEEDKELGDDDEVPELELDDDDEVISKRDVYSLTGQDGRTQGIKPEDYYE